MTNESHIYMPILDDRRLDDELAEARRVLRHWQEKFVSGNDNPVRSRHITAIDIDVRDTEAFFERWPIISDRQQAQQLAALKAALRQVRISDGCWCVEPKPIRHSDTCCQIRKGLFALAAISGKETKA